MVEQLINGIENLSKNIICSKGDVLLTGYVHPSNDNKAFQLSYDFNKLNHQKVNIESLLSPSIYELLEKINPDLIEKIHILNILNDDQADIFILTKHITKDIGIKQKYILFRTSRTINPNDNTICFINQDMSLINDELKSKYLNQLKVNTNVCEPLIFNYGKTLIRVKNSNLNDLDTNTEIDLNFIIDFQLLVSDDLPIHMENFTGLMFKKIFHNLKVFIDNLNK